MKIRQSRVDRCTSEGTLRGSETLAGSRSCCGNDVFDVRTVCGQHPCGLGAQWRENDLAAIIIIVVQTRHERHEFPSCDGEIRDGTPCGLTKPAN